MIYNRKYFLLISLLFINYTIAEIEGPSLTADEIEVISNNPEQEYVYIDLKTRNNLIQLKNLLPDYKFSQQTDDTIAYITSGGTSTYKSIAQSVLDECINAVDINSELIKKTNDISKFKSNLIAYQEALNNNSAQIIVDDNSDTNLNETILNGAITKGRKKKVYCLLTVKDCLKVCGTLKAKNACIGNLVVAGNEIVGGDLTVNGRLIVNNTVIGGATGATGANGANGANGATGATGATGPVDISGTPFAIVLFDSSGNGLTESTGTPPVKIEGTNDVTNVHDLNMNGNLNMVNTTSSSVGVINKSSTRFIHDYPGDGNNFFAGSGAGNFSMSGTGNIGIGNNALNANISGSFNSAVGYHALQSTTNSNSTAFGANALAANINGIENTAVGSSALAANINGPFNVAVGFQALANLTGGIANTAIGHQALKNLKTGIFNVGIGLMAGIQYLTNESDNICISNAGETNDDRIIRIGDINIHTGCFIQGIDTVNVGVGSTEVFVNGNGQLGTVPSSRKYKENINDMKEKSSNIMKLRPVTFNFKSDKTGSQQYGLIAEEVDEIMKDLVNYKNGKPESVKYRTLSVLLLNELQKLKSNYDKSIADLYKKIEKLEKTKK